MVRFFEIKPAFNMDYFFTIGTIVLALSFLFSLLETAVFGFFSEFSFKTGVPVFYRKIDSIKINNAVFTGKNLEASVGVYRFSANRKICFRTYGFQDDLRHFELLPIRATGTLQENNQLKIVGRIPVGATMIFLSFTIICVAAILRDGMSPVIFFLAIIWLIFGYSIHKEQRKMDQMVWELEQIMKAHPSNSEKPQEV
jgi:hypothetical protein